MQPARKEGRKEGVECADRKAPDGKNRHEPGQKRAPRNLVLGSRGEAAEERGDPGRLRSLRLSAASPREPRTIPWSPFLARFMAAFAVWGFAVGAFNPFFTAYFSRRLHAAETQIGLVFSAAQLVQVGAVLLAPFILRRLGVIGGIVSLQLAAGAALALLAPGPPLVIAGVLYTAFMSFQSMCEPGA